MLLLVVILAIAALAIVLTRVLRRARGLMLRVLLRLSLLRGRRAISGRNVSQFSLFLLH